MAAIADLNDGARNNLKGVAQQGGDASIAWLEQAKVVLGDNLGRQR